MFALCCVFQPTVIVAECGCMWEGIRSDVCLCRTGVVFEYSAEKAIVDTSDQGKPWPYNEFMKLQYGIGYYSPIDCNHTTVPCEYNPYPEFDLLADKFASVDTSFAPNRDAYVPTGTIPTCPAGFPPLSDFVWPVDDEPDLPCYIVPTAPPTLKAST